MNQSREGSAKAQMRPEVSVVLATFNGAAYLREQLESILDQTWQDIEIVAYDDGSTDGTLSILEQYPQVRTYRAEERGGVVVNFQRGISRATGRYVAFCDQDDIWLKNRLEASVTAMQQLERARGSDTPILVHSDLCVVDKDLRTMAPSFYRSIGRDPGRYSFGRLLVQGAVTGSTCLMNRPLIGLAFPIPETAMMHDWWVALVAKVFGEIGYIDCPTVLYRQHGRNVIGGTRKKDPLTHRFMRFAKLQTSNERYRRNFVGRIRQAAAFQERFGAQLPKKLVDQLDAYCSLLEQSFVRKRWSILSHGFLNGRLSENIEMMLRL